MNNNPHSLINKLTTSYNLKPFGYYSVIPKQVTVRIRLFAH